MKVLVINSKGLWSFPSYIEAGEFRREMVWSLNEAEFMEAFNGSPMDFTYSNLVIWTDGEDE